MQRAKHTLFELNSYQPLKKHFGDKYFVLPQACPSGPSHHIWGIFPSFFLEYSKGFFKDALEKARINTHGCKRLFVINPDYAVIKKENVLSIESYKADNVSAGDIDIKDMDEIVEKNISECIKGKKNVHRPNIWFLSEEMKGDFDEYLEKYRRGDFKRKNKEPKYILMFLKKDNEDTFIHSVIDCKSYKNKIPKSQIDKIKMDAAFCGAKECYILTNAEKNYSGERNVKFPSNDKYLIKVKDFEQPKPISKNEFWKKYRDNVKEFCK